MTVLDVVKWLFAGLTLISFLSFYWSVIGVFRKPEGEFLKMYQVLQASTGFTWIYSLFSIYSTDFHLIGIQVLGLVMGGFSLSLFWITRRFISKKDFAIVFNSEAPTHLETKGPYRWVRHPFYTSYLLCYLSVFIFTLDPIMLAAFAMMYWVYYQAYKGEEAKFLGTQFVDEYQAYAKRTGALVPKFPFSNGGSGS